MKQLNLFIIVLVISLMLAGTVYGKKKVKVQRVDKIDFGEDDSASITEYEVKDNLLVWYAADGTVRGKGEYREISSNGKTVYIKNGTWILYDIDSSNYHEGEFQNNIRTGLWTTCTEDKKKIAETTYVDDRKQGPAREFYETGELMAEGSYTNGNRSGTWTGYHENGKVNMTGRFVDDQMEGTWKEYSPEGKLTSEGNYTKGLKNGIFIYYTSSGDVKNRIQYRNDQITWLWEYQDGKLTGEGEIFGEPPEHTRNGSWIEYYFPEGTKKFESVGNGGFIMGKKTGKFREYYPGNRLRAVGEYLQDKKNGEWIFYLEDGKTVDNEKSGAYMMGELRRELSKPSDKTKSDFDIDMDNFDMNFE